MYFIPRLIMACARQAEDSSGSGASCGALPWITEPYFQQRKIWPMKGRHILANYDDNTIVVYQAYNPQIAKYAVEHQQ